MYLKNTSGGRHPLAKLTMRQVDHIRDSYTRKPSELTQKEFCQDWGALFGVSMRCILNVVHGNRWRNIERAT